MAVHFGVYVLENICDTVEHLMYSTSVYVIPGHQRAGRCRCPTKVMWKTPSGTSWADCGPPAHM